MFNHPLPACDGSRPYVFVSYAHDDKVSIYQEIRQLQDQGFEVWWDGGISPGSSWSQALAEAIEDCSLFLIFVSPSAVRSDNCHREVAFALDTKRSFLAVHLEKTDLPSGWKLNIGDKQAIIREQLSSAEYSRTLLDAVSEHLPAFSAQVVDGASEMQHQRTSRWWLSVFPILVLAAIIAVALDTYFELRTSAANEQWANEKIPEVDQLIAEERYVEAFDLVIQLKDRVPERPEVAGLLARTSRNPQIDTVPSGAQVAYRFYANDGAEWIHVGSTPAQEFVPLGTKIWRISMEGYETQNLISRHSPSQYFGPVHLQPSGSTPAGMVFVQGGEIDDPDIPQPSMDSFYIGRREVTNREYQAFVDVGAYSDPSYWQDMVFRHNDRIIDWSEAMRALVDTTGRPAPANWALGRYPDGEEEWPVGGVSWYEATAYARFAGKALPTTAHWIFAVFDRNAFGQRLFGDFVSKSNLDGNQVLPAGESQALIRVGAADMLGNVREWALNEQGDGHAIVGASWKQYPGMVGLIDSAPSFDRSEINGIRLATYRRNSSLEATLEPGKENLFKDPVSDDAYQLLLHDLTYTPVDIATAVTSLQPIEGVSWSWQRLQIALPDGDLLKVHLFLPRNAKEPFQVVLYAPGAGAYYRDEFIGYDPGLDPRFIVKTGRALVFPEYRGTFTRPRLPLENTAQSNREDMIARRMETGIVIDYLNSRTDLNSDRLAYLGFSEGAGWFVPIVAAEERIDAAVFVSGGLETGRSLHPIAEAINYIPRIDIPVLMINGRHDGVYPYETSQRALYDMLGTPADDKKHVLLNAGHGLAPQNEVMAATADWLDRHLGPVE
jgi:predicted esterase